MSAVFAGLAPCHPGSQLWVCQVQVDVGIVDFLTFGVHRQVAKRGVASETSRVILVELGLLEVRGAHAEIWTHVHVQAWEVSEVSKVSKTHHLWHLAHLLLLSSPHFDVRVWVEHIHLQKAYATVGDALTATFVGALVDKSVVYHTYSTF